jgi:hypothetical protein
MIDLVPRRDDPVRNTTWKAAIELTVGTGALDIVDPVVQSSTVGARFKHMFEDEVLVTQWLFYPAKREHPTPETKDKLVGNTFNCIARIGAVGAKPEVMLKDVYSNYKALDNEGAFFERHKVDVAVINHRATGRELPILLNEKELATVIGWPLGGSNVITARRIPPTIVHDSQGIVIGESNSSRARGRKVAIPPHALTVHTWVLGPSGTGKSTLLHNMATQIMQRGMGLVLIEPKSDLAIDVLKSVPHDRIDDVIWLDPLDQERPIGLNILAGNDPERVTSHIVGMFKNLSGDSWSGQLQRVMRNAVITAALNGLTLYDVKQLLVNKEYRQAQVKRINRNIHPDIIQEWRWLDDKADLTVDSAVNRLDAFLGSRMIRNIVSQQHGLNIDEVVRQRKILLVPINEARMGQTNAAALGQLVFEMVWNATLRRPIGEREPNVLMADEFQMFTEILSTSKTDPFALARSYGLGLIVANQYADQLPREVQQTVSKNAQSQIVFRLANDDAKALHETFAPLKAGELANLPQFGVAAKLMSSSGNAPVVTLKTPPPPMPTGAANAAWERSRARYGRPVAEVEAELLTRHKNAAPRKKATIGVMENDE